MTALALQHTLALTEPGAIALFLVIFGVLMAASVLLSRALDRFGIPVVLLFLVLGMLGGSEGIGGIAFDDHRFAFQAGAIALILILLDGGLSTRYASIRESAKPASLLATLGVLATAALVAAFGRLLGLPWTQAILVGAIVSSTDAAAVFAVLRGGRLALRRRVQSTLEVESCVNDPMAVILTTAIVAWVSTGAAPGWRLALLVLLQLAVGLFVGLACGHLARLALARARISTAALFSVITLASGFISFGLATLLAGSGFLAVFATAVVLGNGPLPYRTGLIRIHEAFAWLSQIAMFLMLGLLVFPSRLLPVAGIGLALGLFLAIVARPLAVAILLAPLRFPAKEVAYIGCVGLRGAVPIVLATIPVMAGIPAADQVFHVVFFIVVVSTLIPGASIVPLTRKLHLQEAAPPVPPAALEIASLRELEGDILCFHVDTTLAVCGVSLAKIHFPSTAAALLIVRGAQLIAPRGQTVLQPGDFVYVLCQTADRPYIELLFGSPQLATQQADD